MNVKFYTEYQDGELIQLNWDTNASKKYDNADDLIASILSNNQEDYPDVENIVEKDEISKLFDTGGTWNGPFSNYINIVGLDGEQLYTRHPSRPVIIIEKI